MAFNVMKFIVVFIGWVLCLSVEVAPRGVVAQPAVLHQNDGELRTRRPREGVASPSTEFLLKIGPKTNGSQHLLVFSEEMPPGAAIPRHRHHGEEEIILIQSGRAHVWLGDQEYDAESGALVFIPTDTWVSLRNTGTDPLGLMAIWNEPGFEDMLRCGSVPTGQPAEPLSREGVKDCYHHGDAELR